MNRLRFLIGLTAAAFLTVGCGEQPTGLSTRRAPPPAFAIFDGAHNGGNPGFFLLPPLVSSPAGDREFGDSPFAASVAPRVVICRLAGDPNLGSTDCVAGDPLLSFSGSQIKVAPPQFHVNWHTDQVALNTSAFYRIQIFVQDQLMGFADLDPVANSRELKRAKTAEVIPLVDGRTLPIKFTIENDALCPTTRPCTKVRVTNEGGSFTLPSGTGGILLRPDWLPDGVDEVTLTLEDLALGTDNICHVPGGFTGTGLVVQFEGCMSITTEPDLTPGEATGIQKEAIIGLCLESDGQGESIRQFLQIFKSDPGRPLLVLEDADLSLPQNFIEGFSCEGYAGTPAPPPVIGLSSHPLLHYASTRFDNLTRRLARLIEPQPVYAIDLGEGGKLPVFEDFSRFVWGSRRIVVATSPTTQVVAGGRIATPTVKVTRRSHGPEPVVEPVGGVLVTFAFGSPVSGSLSSPTALTDEEGFASTNWTLGTAPGTYTLIASVAGGAPVSFAATVPVGPVVAGIEICTTASIAEYCDDDPLIYDDNPPYDRYEFTAIPRDAEGNDLRSEVSCAWSTAGDTRLGSIAPTAGDVTTFTAAIGSYEGNEDSPANPAFTLAATCGGVTNSIVLTVNGGSSVYTVEVTSSTEVSDLMVGSSLELTARPVDGEGVFVPRVPCTAWSSSDPTKVTVSPTTGSTTTATAIAPAVDVAITATCGASVIKRGSFNLEVTSSPLFRATFANDLLDQAPGAPEVGTWNLSSVVDGTALVRQSVGNLARALEVSTPGEIPGAPSVTANIAGTPPTAGVYRARWRSVTTAGGPTMNFTLRSSGGLIIGGIGYGSTGNIRFNPGAEFSPNVGTWTANVAQLFELEVNLTAKTVRLSIDGVPVAGVQDVGYFQTGAANLATLIIDFGGLGAYTMGWDDIEIVPVPPG